MNWNYDCRYFSGEKPCIYKRLCEGCKYYSPAGKRIIIIKLGAMGDVLRTTCLLTTLKKKYHPAHITWVVEENSKPLLLSNPYIDKIIPYSADAVLTLLPQRFYIGICLDKSPSATSLLSLLKAKKKRGFEMGIEGYTKPTDKKSMSAFRLGLDDELKFHKNKKSYQQIIFEQMGFKFSGEEYVFVLSEEEKEFAAFFRKKNKLNAGKLIIGLNSGAGKVFANKAWTIEGYAKLIKRLQKELKAKIILFGGPEEMQKNSKIKKLSRAPIIDAGCNNSLRNFSALLSLCDVIVSGDTVAMHLGIALKRKVVAIFGPTSAEEIELYGRGEKVISTISCAPCYQNFCDIHPNCMEKISVDDVLSAVKKIINSKSDFR